MEKKTQNSQESGTYGWEKDLLTSEHNLVFKPIWRGNKCVDKPEWWDFLGQGKWIQEKLSLGATRFAYLELPKP